MKRIITTTIFLCFTASDLFARSISLVNGSSGQQRFSVGADNNGAVGNSLLRAANSFLDIMNGPWVASLSGVVFVALVIGWVIFQKDEDTKSGIIRIIIGTMIISLAPGFAVMFAKITWTAGALR